jgi:hypothetical protein
VKVESKEGPSSCRSFDSLNLFKLNIILSAALAGTDYLLGDNCLDGCCCSVRCRRNAYCYIVGRRKKNSFVADIPATVHRNFDFKAAATTTAAAEVKSISFEQAGAFDPQLRGAQTYSSQDRNFEEEAKLLCWRPARLLPSRKKFLGRPLLRLRRHYSKFKLIKYLFPTESLRWR